MKRSALILALATLGAAPPITSPRKLCHNEALSEDDFCLDAPRMERLMRSGDLRLVSLEPPKRGTTELEVRTYEIKDGGETIRFRAKWKASKPDGEGFNNSPRKEISAYRFQKLFLDPDEYVVPPTTLRCFSSGEPTFPGTRCTLGVLTYWLENVTDKRVFHEYRFERNAYYRKSIANLNLFTYLINHRDVHEGNFLISQDLARPRAFSIDNGIAFSGLFNPKPFIEDVPVWSRIIVPSLPREKIEVLRRITRAQLDALGTAIQFEVRGGMLVEVKPEAPFDPERGVRVRGGTIQLGLTRSEIDDVAKRIEKLVERVDEREIALFD
jgi:hypothetical protein